MTTTISLIDQLRASQALYDAELARYEQLTDAELARALGTASDATIARVLGFASGATIDRVLGTATIDRVLGTARGATIDRVLGTASGATIARVLGTASGATIDRVLGTASDATIDRALGTASGATIARVLGFASDATIARLQIAVPVVEDLDRRVHEAVGDGSRLSMDRWHCGTTHCRGGWAITLAGEEGQALASKLGNETAARLIYEASTGRVAPDFYASNEEALADIKRCAGVA